MDNFVDWIAAQAAVQQADVANRAFCLSIVSLGLTAVALVANVIIALVAIRGPERERHVRDLKDRKRRARLEQRAASAGLQALAVIRRVEVYASKHKNTTSFNMNQVNLYKRRLAVRMKVIDHFLSLQLRDVNIVGWLIETGEFSKAVEVSIIGDPSLLYGNPFLSSLQVISYRTSRSAALRENFQLFAAKKKKKDVSLQGDIDSVTRLLWYLDFNW